VLIAIDHAASVLPHFRASAHYAVSILRDTQQHLSSQFARRPDAERFDGVPWHPGTTGAPVLDAALAVFECRVYNVVEAGDHALFIGEVMHTRAGNGAPLLYFHGAYRFLEPLP
jgi:flavin reductase (DIM6/NTAB) family NADH-FMN oxidoreductase RutF